MAEAAWWWRRARVCHRNQNITGGAEMRPTHEHSSPDPPTLLLRRAESEGKRVLRAFLRGCCGQVPLEERVGFFQDHPRPSLPFEREGASARERAL
ncbi:hypothetical protein MTO96_051633 [Rhipicephalus appendiculatus]